MNPKTSRARRSAVAFTAVGALAAAGITTGASPASAVTALGLSTPATATTFDFGAAISGGALPARLANATFGTKVTTAVSGTRQIVLDSYTAPTGVTVAPATATLYFNSQASGAATAPTSGWSSNLTLASPTSANLTGTDVTGDLFFTANKPGRYTMHFVDSGATAGTDDDAVSPTITLNVLDVEGVTSDTSDDWRPTVTNSATSASIGDPVAATVNLNAVTLADTRGTSSGNGILGAAVANLVGLGFTGAGASVAVGAGSFTGTTVTRGVPVNSTNTTGSLATGAVVDSDGNGITGADRALGTDTTTVTANGVTSAALTAPAVTGTVKATGAAVAVKTGTAAVTYSVQVGPTSLADKSGKTVYFTLTPGTGTPVLSAGGTLVSSSSGTKIYAATTDADGVARLTVTSGTTTAGTTYTVSASSGTSGASTTFTATYADAAAGSFEITNTGTTLYPTVGTANVTVTGRLLDQFGAAFQTGSTTSQQVNVTIDENASGCVYSTSDLGNQFASLSNGTFSFVYTPGSTPTAGRCDVVRATYGSATTDVPVRWASSAAASSVTLGTPTEGATDVAISGDNGPVTAQNAATYGNATGEITGRVLDSANTGLAYRTVRLTGSEGVYFSTATAGSALVTTIDVATDASGNYSGVYAVYTRPGTATVTATAGGPSVTRTVTVTGATRAYRVTVDDTSGEPGTTIIVTGKVTDIFGNPVVGRKVNLSTDPATTGALANSDVTTGSTGLWSTSYVIGSNKGGDVKLTATLYNAAGTALLTTNPTATAFNTATGLSLGAGAYRAEGTLQISPPVADVVTLAGPSSLSRAGTATLSGTAKPGVTVDIFARAATSGAPLLLVDSVTADATDGTYSVVVSVPASRTFLARTATAKSSPITITVPVVTPRPAVKKSGINFKVKALGRGRVLLTVDGAPNARGTAIFWVATKSGSVKISTKTTNTLGIAAVTYTTSRTTHVFRARFQAPGYSPSVVLNKALRVS